MDDLQMTALPKDVIKEARETIARWYAGKPADPAQLRHAETVFVPWLEAFDLAAHQARWERTKKSEESGADGLDALESALRHAERRLLKHTKDERVYVPRKSDTLKIRQLRRAAKWLRAGLTAPVHEMTAYYERPERAWFIRAQLAPLVRGSGFASMAEMLKAKAISLTVLASMTLLAGFRPPRPRRAQGSDVEHGRWILRREKELVRKAVHAKPREDDPDHPLALIATQMRKSKST